MESAVAGIVVIAILGAGIMASSKPPQVNHSQHQHHQHHSHPNRTQTSNYLQDELNTKNLIEAQYSYLYSIMEELKETPSHKKTDWIHIVFPSDRIGYAQLRREHRGAYEDEKSKIYVTPETAQLFLEKGNPLWYDVLKFIQGHPLCITNPSDLRVIEHFYEFWDKYPEKPLRLKSMIDDLRKARIGLEHRGGRRTRKLR